MDDDEILAAVEGERLSLCAVLDDLELREWQQPSLCPGWVVQDVVAHLTTPTRYRLRDVVIGAIKARGNFDRMNAREARDLADRYPPAELVAQLRETAGLDRRMIGSAPMDPLLDILVHGQDITRPLGRTRTMPPHLAAAAATYVAGNSFHGGPERVAGLRLIATDTQWSYGRGPHEVSGPIADLLLAVTGRPAGPVTLSPRSTPRSTQES